MEFPVTQIGFHLPSWLGALPYEAPLHASIISTLREASGDIFEIKDVYRAASVLSANQNIETVSVFQIDMGTGCVIFELVLPKSLYYETISMHSGFDIQDDGQLLSLLTELRNVKSEYDLISKALMDVRSTGYGIVIPNTEDLKLQEPEIVKQGGKYSVKLKANAPAIHMIMTNIETTVTPAIGGENASEEIINFLLQGYEGDTSRIWESNIFGKSLYDIASDGVNAKIAGMSQNARSKFQETLQRVINEGAGGLICIIL